MKFATTGKYHHYGGTTKRNKLSYTSNFRSEIFYKSKLENKN